MTTKIVYQTDHLGILIGSTTADPCPVVVGEWLFPGGCVETPPPSPGEHQVPRWNGKRWELISSYRGLTVYKTLTGEALVIDRLGELPSGYTLSAPAPGQVWKDGEWVDDIPATVVRRHLEQSQLINNSCKTAITSGFWSDALGSPNRYGSELDDQLNLISVSMAGRAALYACSDKSGVKDFKPHTFAQIRQVSDDFSAFKLELLQKANQLKQQLDKALEDGDLAAIEASTWESVQ